MTRPHHRSLYEVLMVWFASISTAIVSLGIVGLTATFWWPYEPFSKLDLAVVNEPHPGDKILARLDYCKTVEDAPVAVRWTLINDITILLDDQVASLPSGCHVTTRIFMLPPQTPVGTYRLQVEGVYQPWPWRRVPYLRRTQAFEVTP